MAALGRNPACIPSGGSKETATPGIRGQPEGAKVQRIPLAARCVVIPRLPGTSAGGRRGGGSTHAVQGAQLGLRRQAPRRLGCLCVAHADVWPMQLGDAHGGPAWLSGPKWTGRRSGLPCRSCGERSQVGTSPTGPPCESRGVQGRPAHTGSPAFMHAEPKVVCVAGARRGVWRRA